MMRPTELQQTAVHEAGHACVALALGCAIQHVHVLRGGGAQGRCCCSLPDDPRAQAALLCAGDCATDLLEFYPAPTKTVGNWITRTAANRGGLASGNASPTDTEHLTRLSEHDQVQGVRAAHSILTTHWPIVVAIGNALLDVGYLSGDMVQQIAAGLGGVAPYAFPAFAAPGPTFAAAHRRLNKRDGRHGTHSARRTLVPVRLEELTPDQVGILAPHILARPLPARIDPELLPAGERNVLAPLIAAAGARALIDIHG